MDRTVYVGCQSVGSTDDIQGQTDAVFEQLTAVLEAAGASMADLVNLRTYYVYRGPDGPAVTQYWNDMTAVRMRYLRSPGPAATALRVQGAPGRANLIGVDAIVSLDTDRRRLMPEHAWDWTIPTPFSQGWRIGDRVFVGGQISADRSGKALAPDDITTQAAITLDYIRHVLLSAGYTWSMVAALRIGYRHHPLHGEAYLVEILRAVRAAIAAPRPAVTAFGVDLLYEGLMLEIDAVAGRADRQAVDVKGGGWGGFDGFPAFNRSGNELHVGGLSASTAGSLMAQVEATFERLLAVLQEAGFGCETLVKITLFYVARLESVDSPEESALILAIARRHLPQPGPVVTLVAVASLPHRDQRFQLDAVAVLSHEVRVAIDAAEVKRK